MNDILIVILAPGGPVRRTDLAALGFGLEAASRSGASCDALLVGPGSADAAPAVARLGPRRVYTANHDDLAHYTAEAFSSAISGFLEGRGTDTPYRLLGAATTSATRETFPRLAALLNAPMATDVLAIEAIDGNAARFTRAVFVGNLLATVELTGPRVLATCRASEFDVPAERDEAAAVEAVTLVSGLVHPGKRHVGSRQAESDRPDLGEAEVVVTAGRGTKGPDEGIPLVEELADLLGAAVGATRAVVDAGWLPNELQVGQTGKIVAPKMYIAVGVSGAIQHLAGMRNSKTIVAINKDPEAPIFEVADLGLVADLFDAVPALIEEIRKVRT